VPRKDVGSSPTTSIWLIPDDIDQDNDMIADLFEGRAR
jgi:hypothetical protein